MSGVAILLPGHAPTLTPQPKTAAHLVRVRVRVRIRVRVRVGVRGRGRDGVRVGIRVRVRRRRPTSKSPRSPSERCRRCLDGQSKAAE